MASTNKTSNLELSQFIATDTPTWLVDYNGDMEKIDAGVGRVKELAETASTQAVGVASELQTTNQTVTTLSGQVANVQNQANSATASVNGINQRLGNTDISGIGDGTITGAINAQNSNLTKLELLESQTNPNVALKTVTIPNGAKSALFSYVTSSNGVRYDLIHVPLSLKSDNAIYAGFTNGDTSYVMTYYIKENTIEFGCQSVAVNAGLVAKVSFFN